MKCKSCGKEVAKLVAREMCQRCYGLDVEKKKSAECRGCGEVKPIKAKGLCRKCYARFQRHGDFDDHSPVKGARLCSHCGERPVHAKELCGSCYSRLLERGRPDKIKVKKYEACSYCGDIGWIKAKGLCGACYNYQLQHGTLERKNIQRIRDCVVCDNKGFIVSKGICRNCYVRFWKTGSFRTRAGKYEDISPESFGLDIPSEEKLLERRQRENLKNRRARKQYPDRYKNADLLKTFGITLKKYNKMLEGQNGVCAICEEKETAKRNGKTLSLAVDHDHNTGKVRALLCQACNHGIGHMRDSPTLLTAAINYLKNHASSEA
jgi:hypothetical protein